MVKNVAVYSTIYLEFSIENSYRFVDTHLYTICVPDVAKKALSEPLRQIKRYIAYPS